MQKCAGPVTRTKLSFAIRKVKLPNTSLIVGGQERAKVEIFLILFFLHV